VIAVSPRERIEPAAAIVKGLDEGEALNGPLGKTARLEELRALAVPIAVARRMPAAKSGGHGARQVLTDAQW
jgi:hypothetical protein